jgi:hypothetical protein
VDERATIGAVGRVGAVALVVAACSVRPGPTFGDGVAPALCSASAPPMPVVHLGPDVTIRAICGGSGQAAVASVDEHGPGVTAWSISVRGTPSSAFSLKQTTFRTCQTDGPMVALVFFQAPPGAVPGDAFDAVVTVDADDGSFAAGTVNVHAEIVKPWVTIDKANLEFGDVLPGASPMQTLSVSAPDGVNVFFEMVGSLDSFSLARIPPQTKGNTSAWSVTFEAFLPGDHSASLRFASSPILDSPPACGWTATIGLHARVVADGGAPDGDAPVSEGGVD